MFSKFSNNNWKSISSKHKNILLSNVKWIRSHLSPGKKNNWFDQFKLCLLSISCFFCSWSCFISQNLFDHLVFDFDWIDWKCITTKLFGMWFPLLVLDFVLIEQRKWWKLKIARITLLIVWLELLQFMKTIEINFFKMQIDLVIFLFF